MMDDVGDKRTPQRLEIKYPGLFCVSHVIFLLRQRLRSKVEKNDFWNMFFPSVHSGDLFAKLIRST